VPAGVLIQVPNALEPLVVWIEPKSRHESAVWPLPEPPNHRILAPLFSSIVAVNVQLNAQAACGASQSVRRKKTNKNFEVRPRVHLEPQFGTTKCPFPALATYKFPATRHESTVPPVPE
jgi:hypothetical protein